MATTSKKRTTKRVVKPVSVAPPAQPKNHLRRIIDAYKSNLNDLRARRPHRSFRLTYRRDYKRSLKLPCYIAFTREVWRTLWQNKRLFGSLILAYSLISALLVGIASQDTYSQIQSIVDQSSQSFFTGAWGELGKAALLLVSGVTGSFMPELTEGQQIYSGFLVLMTWLATVWLLRALFAGTKPRLRDALYSSGSPIIATILVLFFVIIQSLPLAAAFIIYSIVAASLTGVLSMVFWIAASLLAVLSLYWITGSFMALIIVTLPGMYPWQAIRSAGDLVIGRRLRVLYRIVWLLMTIFVVWVITVIPVILLDKWLMGIIPALKSAPVVPVVLLLVTSFVTVWSSAYVYILYRKVVDDDAAPA